MNLKSINHCNNNNNNNNNNNSNDDCTAPAVLDDNNKNRRNKALAAVSRKASVKSSPSCCPKQPDNHSARRKTQAQAGDDAKNMAVKEITKNGVTYKYKLRPRGQKLSVLNGVAAGSNWNGQGVASSRTGVTVDQVGRFRRKADKKKLPENAKEQNENDKENIGSRVRIDRGTEMGESFMEIIQKYAESEQLNDCGQAEGLVLAEELIPQPMSPNILTTADNDYDVYGFKEYAADILEYSLCLEENRKLPETFLSSSPGIDSAARAILVDWLIQVADHLYLLQPTLELCIDMVDRYVNGNKVKLDFYQLLGLTCLLVSSKYEERFAPDIKSLLYLTQDMYTFEQVTQQECLILQGLAFQVGSPVPCQYVPVLVQALEKENEDYELGEKFYRKVENMARYFLVLVTTEASFAVLPASVRASAAVSLAFEILTDGVFGNRDCKYFFYRLIKVEGVSSSEVKSCTVAMAKFIRKAPTAQHQGARVMFSTTDFDCVSHSSSLSNSSTLEWLASQ